MLKKLLKITVLFGIFTNFCMGAETKFVTWQEEVKLNDGRVIVVNQRRRYEGGYSGSDFGNTPRESWLTVKLPETDNQETTWHEKLEPSHINIAKGRLYIVAFPMTDREFYLYNRPRPPYIGYVFENKAWRRIPFSEIPVEMYNTNLSIDSEEYIHAGRITLTDKEKAFSDPRVSKEVKRIDPSYKDPSDNGSNPKIYQPKIF